MSLPIVTANDAPLRFDCMQCGECCRAWTVPVPVAHVKEHLQVDWVRERSKEMKASGVGPLLPSKRGASVCTLNTGVGERLDCVFLGEGGLCDIHSRIGVDAKPAPCRQFPFHFTQTPLGVEAYLDPACKAVSAGAGPEVPSTELQAIAGYGTVEDLGALEWRSGRAMSWDEYDALRVGVRGVLTGDGPVNARVWRAWHLARTGAEPAAQFADRGVDPLGRRLVLTMLLLVFRNAWEQKRRGQSSFARSMRLLGLAFGLLLGGGRVPIEARGIVVNAGDVDDIPWDPDAPAIRPVLDRWLAGFADRHELAPMAARGGGILLANLLLISWFSRAVASAAGRAVTEADVVDGIQLTEKFGGSRMLAPQIGRGALGGGLRSILEGPNLPRQSLR